MNKEQVMRIARAALQAVDPIRAVREAVRRKDNLLHIGNKKYDLEQYKHVFVVGGGKAGAPMAQALSEILEERFTAGWINVKQGHLTGVPLPENLTVCEAGHPIPDKAGMRGARQIVDMVKGATAQDIVFCLISGGGSALLPLPVDGITLADLQSLTDALLRCGATINEINAVRKHCSQIKGGQLARIAFPATVVSLVLSDVVGNPLDVIASGPTVPDPTTFSDAYGVLVKYGVVDAVPASIVTRVRAGRDGDWPETPKAGDPIFAQVQDVIVGSNAIAARGAQVAAAAMGFNTLLLSTYIEGEAREVGRVMAGIAKSLASEGWPLPKPACIIAGGETTVTVRGSGKGGRNQELALASALALDGWPDIVIATLATDGTDGPTDAAGAIITGETIQRAREQGMSAIDFLARNDAYTFFDRLGDLIRTGPTNTNVNDLLFILAR